MFSAILKRINPFNRRRKKPLVKLVPCDVMMLCIDDLKDVLPGGGVTRVCATLFLSEDGTMFQVTYHLLAGNTKLTELETDLYATSSLNEGTTEKRAATLAVRRHISDIRGIKHVS